MRFALYCDSTCPPCVQVVVVEEKEEEGKEEE